MGKTDRKLQAVEESELEGAEAGIPDDWPIDIILHKPLQGIDGSEIQVLTLQEPTVKRLRALDGARGRIDELVRLTSRLTGQPPKVVEQIGPRDLMRLLEVLEGFFSSSPGDLPVED